MLQTGIIRRRACDSIALQVLGITGVGMVGQCMVFKQDDETVCV